MSRPRMGFRLDLRDFANYAGSSRGGLKHEAEKLNKIKLVVPTGFEPVLKDGCDFALFSMGFRTFSQIHKGAT